MIGYMRELHLDSYLYSKTLSKACPYNFSSGTGTALVYVFFL